MTEPRPPVAAPPITESAPHGGQPRRPNPRTAAARAARAHPAAARGAHDRRGSGRGLDASGFCIEGRAGKVVSYQLRYELARGRVRRVGRGLYAAEKVTRQERWRMQRRISTLRTDAHGGDIRETGALLSLRGATATTQADLGAAAVGLNVVGVWRQ